MPRAKILYIEDNAENRLLVREILEAAGYLMIEAEEGSTGILKAISERPDLVLMDIMMPGLDGREVTTYLRGIPELEKVPIVALTASVMKGERESVLAAGCSGYLQKPIDIDRLPGQIQAFLDGKMEVLSPDEERSYLRKHNRQLAERLVQKVRQLSDLSEANKRLVNLAWIDELTGLPNHRYLQWRVRSELEAARRLKGPLSCMMTQLDDVKRTGSSSSSESLLRLFAKLLSENRRVYDVMGRYSRNKFLLLFHIDGEKAIMIAERIRSEAESNPIAEDGDKPVKFTVSLGISTLKEGRPISEKDLIRQADEALLEASEAGGNRSVLYGHGTRRSSPEKN